MKQNHEKKFAGVWLDNQHAMIISNENGQGYDISNKIKATLSQGGGSEHSMNNSKQTENLKYFKALSAQLTTYDEVLLFGPGQSQEQFQHHLNEDAQFKTKKVTIDSSDNLTDPQMIAKVRDHFQGR